MQRTPAIYSYASGIGAKYHGTSQGPLTFKEKFLKAHPDYTHCWQDIIKPSSEGEKLNSHAALPEIAKLSNLLASCTFSAARHNQFPIVIGGDHSCAIGTWSGVSAAHEKEGPIGLLWFDAHMDSHIMQTSPYGRIHGMPVAALLGYGAKELITVKTNQPKILPEHLCMIGIRDYEPEEKDFLEQLKVRIYFMDEVKKRGLRTVVEEALAHIREKTSAYGLSIDLDGFDPTDAPGTGSPVPEGLKKQEFLDCLELFRNDSQLIGLELAEYNPEFDQDNKTYALLEAIVKPFMN